MIIINGKFLTQRVTGVQRYAREIVSRFNGFGIDNVTITPSESISDWNVRETVSFGKLPGNLWEQIELPQASRSGKNVLWCPCNVAPIISSNTVVTIHDLFAIENPEWVSKNFHNWYKFMMPIISRKSRRILTDSEYSKSRIISLLKVPDSKIDVIPCGVSPKFSIPLQEEIIRIKSKYSLEKKYILVLGSLEPRKNLLRTIEAWILSGVDCELVIAGGIGKSAVFGDKVEYEKIARKGVKFLGYVPDDDLPGLYAGSSLFVYAALMEGFGMPPLEAAACGARVITSSTSAMKENSENVSYTVDPLNIESIAHGIASEYDRPEDIREKLNISNFVRDKYNWDTIALKVYNVLLDNR